MPLKFKLKKKEDLKIIIYVEDKNHLKIIRDSIVSRISLRENRFSRVISAYDEGKIVIAELIIKQYRKVPELIFRDEASG